MPLTALNGIDVNNQRIINVASPTLATDAANKAYIDGLINGLSWKQPVRVATTTNGALSSAYANGSTVDGVTLATGDRILIKDQSAGSENGIYVVATSGAPTRPSDASTTAQFNNATVYVMSGSVNADKAFTQTVDNPAIGTSSLVFAQITGSGTSYVAGTGLTLSGSTFSIDPTLTARKLWQNSTAASAGAATTYNHTFNTLDVDIVVIEVASGKRVFMDGTAASANTITVTSGSPVAAGQYRIGIFV